MKTIIVSLNFMLLASNFLAAAPYQPSAEEYYQQRREQPRRDTYGDEASGKYPTYPRQYSPAVPKGYKSDSGYTDLQRRMGPEGYPSDSGYTDYGDQPRR